MLASPVRPNRRAVSVAAWCATEREPRRRSGVRDAGAWPRSDAVAQRRRPRRTVAVAFPATTGNDGVRSSPAAVGPECRPERRARARRGHGREGATVEIPLPNPPPAGAVTGVGSSPAGTSAGNSLPVVMASSSGRFSRECENRHERRKRGSAQIFPEPSTTRGLRDTASSARVLVSTPNAHRRGFRRRSRHGRRTPRAPRNCARWRDIPGVGDFATIPRNLSET